MTRGLRPRGAVVVEGLDHAGLEGHEGRAVRREVGRGRLGDAADHLHVREAGGQARVPRERSVLLGRGVRRLDDRVLEGARRVLVLLRRARELVADVAPSRVAVLADRRGRRHHEGERGDKRERCRDRSTTFPGPMFLPPESSCDARRISP